MDPFKLLSRSTKLKRQQNLGNSHSVPSNGQATSPQLFGHGDLGVKLEDRIHILTDERTTILGKRKRKGERQAWETVPTELDFFGGGVTNGGQGGIDTRKIGSDTKQPEKYGQPLPECRQRMADDERRAILKAHKIKVTVLEELPVPSTTPTSKRKRNKREIMVSSGKKGDKRHIFPEPLTSFSQLRSRYAISQRLGENIDAQGYKEPTEVQLAAMPLLMEEDTLVDVAVSQTVPGFDLLAVAPTGSGKTVAFLVPAINAILRDKRPENNAHTHAIILAPTRELAHQIVNEGQKLVRNTGLRVALMRKGMRLTSTEAWRTSEEAFFSDADDSSASETQQAQRSNGVVKAHIVVSTPLVLANSLGLDKRSTLLPHIKYLILDEADVLLDPLFRDQVGRIWNACSSTDLRVSLWSATMASSIESFATEQIIKRGNLGRVPIVRLVVGLKDSALPTVTHTMTYTGTEAGKLMALRQLLHPVAPDADLNGRKPLRPPFLVFTQTVERAKALQAELQYDIPPEAGGSARMAALHSEMSERSREKIMTAFRRGEIWVIITTDLLARGVDFRGLNGVVNYDVPTSGAVYVHRVGRTGRAGREGGIAVTFYTNEDIPYVKPIANIISASEKLRAVGKEGTSHADLQKWMLDALPTTPKRERKELKRRGIETRRSGVKSAVITTKSGYERRQVNNRKDMKSSARGHRPEPAPQAEDVEFSGFSD